MGTLRIECTRVCDTDRRQQLDCRPYSEHQSTGLEWSISALCISVCAAGFTQWTAAHSPEEHAASSVGSIIRVAMVGFNDEVKTASD